MPRFEAFRLILARPSTTGALAGFFLSASVLLLGVAGHGLSRAPAGTTGLVAANGTTGGEAMDDVTGSIPPASRPSLDQEALQEGAQDLGHRDGTARRAVHGDMDEVPLRGSLPPAGPEHADLVPNR